MIAIPLLMLGEIGWLAYSKVEDGARGQWGQPLGTQRSPLNPHGFPQAQSGSVADLKSALTDFEDHSPKSRDTLAWAAEKFGF